MNNKQYRFKNMNNKQYRDAWTWKYITKKEAEKNPKGTVSETRKTSKKK